jgi:hypothetical protein
MKPVCKKCGKELVGTSTYCSPYCIASYPSTSQAKQKLIEAIKIMQQRNENESAYSEEFYSADEAYKVCIKLIEEILK